MDSSRNTFSYRPLSKPTFEVFEIRLICLHPGSFDDPIYCTIYHANIYKKRLQTKYTALSYVWGDATQTKPIQLRYHQPLTSSPIHVWSSDISRVNYYENFQVTTNLESGLRHLRDRTEKRILWVDAICINQSDLEERQSQVKIMGSVYTNAVSVRIWLGSISDVSVSTPNIQEALESYQSRRISSLKSSSHSFPSPREDMEAALIDKEKIIEVTLLAARAYVMDEGRLQGHETSENWFPDGLESLGMQIIALRPWWRRVWVLQEATLPEEDPVMQCGHITIKYRRFLESAKHCMLLDAPLGPPKIHICLAVHNMLLHKDYDPSKISLPNRLLTYLGCMSGNFEATNPRDRINGLYGFVRMGDCHDNIFIFMMENQYEKDLAEHYHMVAIWLLFDPRPQSHPLRLLENGPSNIERVPSWVPMWESKKWIGESKNNGAPESKFDLLAQGTAMGNIYRKSSIGICARCTAMYKKKWGAPKSVFDIDVRCTAIRIQNALALGRVITVVEVPTLKEQKDIDVLREALVEVEERILAALKAGGVSRAAARAHIHRFRDYFRLNFWDVDAEIVPDSFKWSMTLEDFLQCEGKSRKRKGQQHRNKISGYQTDDNALSASSVAKLSSFFGQVSHLVVGSNIVGHIFEDLLPSWRRGDRLYLIPECRWILGLQRSGKGYRYVYRVFVSDLEWEQRKQLFDEKGTYEDIVLV